MLGSITRSFQDAFGRLDGLTYTSEAKLDGQRIQIHARVYEKEEVGAAKEEIGLGGSWGDLEGPGGRKVFVRLFSRHLEDMTEKVGFFLLFSLWYVQPWCNFSL